jgi:hypothetical protein
MRRASSNGVWSARTAKGGHAFGGEGAKVGSGVHRRAGMEELIGIDVKQPVQPTRHGEADGVSRVELLTCLHLGLRVRQLVVHLGHLGPRGAQFGVVRDARDAIGREARVEVHCRELVGVVEEDVEVRKSYSKVIGHPRVGNRAKVFYGGHDRRA